LRPECVPPAARSDADADGEACEGDGAWDDECGLEEESVVEGVTLLGELWGVCPPACCPPACCPPACCPPACCPPACCPHAVSTPPAIATVRTVAVATLILANATDLPPSAPLGAQFGAGTGHVEAGPSAGALPVDGTAASILRSAGDLRPWASVPMGLPVAPSAPGVGQAAGPVARPRIPRLSMEMAGTSGLGLMSDHSKGGRSLCLIIPICDECRIDSGDERNRAENQAAGVESENGKSRIVTFRDGLIGSAVTDARVSGVNRRPRRLTPC
jgi:hypothetical protein